MLDGDYYPRTAYSTAGDAIMAWQFDVPERGTGIVQAFRRAGCTQETIMLPVKFNDKPAAALFTYRRAHEGK